MIFMALFKTLGSKVGKKGPHNGAKIGPKQAKIGPEQPKRDYKRAKRGPPNGQGRAPQRDINDGWIERA